MSGEDIGNIGYAKKDYEETVIGVITGDGIKIRSCSDHAFDRLMERNIWPKNVINALKMKSVPAKNNNVAYIYGGTYVYVNNKTGTIISSIYKGRKGK